MFRTMKNISNIEMMTQRLRLRPFSTADFEVFVEDMVSDPVVMLFYHSYTPSLSSEARMAKAREDFLEHFESSRERSGLETWALFPRDAASHQEDRMIGWVGILESPIGSMELGPELQYMLASRFHGKGLITEAVRPVIADAFQRCGVRRLRAYVDTTNTGSRRVAEKLGFEFQGQVSAYGSDDMVWYMLEADNFDPKQGALGFD